MVGVDRSRRQVRPVIEVDAHCVLPRPVLDGRRTALSGSKTPPSVR